MTEKELADRQLDALLERLDRLLEQLGPDTTVVRERAELPLQFAS